ncbi:hypothetical protein Tsubulata_021302 [Turnera subulata]|uniref:Uncharacterized protein n=1 Tax=Turnera subulata TaxID=218843 RepID=A0A9Q0FPJ3_9ROSI|nr:hypothetical protein Tsubulata_021302 [Turnera subulata]
MATSKNCIITKHMSPFNSNKCHSSFTSSLSLLPFKTLNTKSQLPPSSTTPRLHILQKHHYSSASSPALSRRLFLPSVSGLWDALTGGNNNPREASSAIRRGMLLFIQGDVVGSLAEFDKAIELDPNLWQRGLSLYYLDRFEEGAEQFRIDVAMNPNDTEESIWCFLCEAQLYGAEEARKRFLEVGRDPRPVMREAYNLFKNGGVPQKLVDAFSGGKDSEVFYASLYAGLYHESQNEPDEAKRHLVSACRTAYGKWSEDYMAALAKVHCQCRKWSYD